MIEAIYWLALAGAVIGSGLFIFAWVGDDLHTLSSYGLGFGPGRHTGYGGMSQLLFIALPAGGCLALAWLLAFFQRWAHHEPLSRSLMWTTGAIGLAALALFAFDRVLDRLGDRARAKDAAAQSQADGIASNHDELVRFVGTHGAIQPLVPGGSTPLQAAAASGFADLVTAFIAQGAVPAEDDLAGAVNRGDRKVVEALLHAHRFNGNFALEAVFSSGHADLLGVLLASHMSDGAAAVLPRMIDPARISLYPGDLDWQKLKSRWLGAQAPPEAVVRNIKSYDPSGGAPDERGVLSILNGLLSSDLCLDKTLSHLPLEGWMKETRLCNCNYCPYVRQINWAVLTALYPDIVPTLEHSKHVAMLRSLATEALKAQTDRKIVLRSAVYNQNLFLIELLEKQGYNLRVLDGEFGASTFLDVTEAQMVKTHLLAKGVRLKN